LKFCKGEKIWAKWENGDWYAGRIMRVNYDDTCEITFDDGDK
jgi:hypothetical protein